jgi:tagatose-1,6-bisphosphate aldolase non-catalytic subunit AgaZ/GatZ
MSVSQAKVRPIVGRGASLLVLSLALVACADRPPAEDPCLLADRPASLAVLAENSTRNVYALCLEERSDAMLEVLFE